MCAGWALAGALFSEIVTTTFLPCCASVAVPLSLEPFCAIMLIFVVMVSAMLDFIILELPAAKAAEVSAPITASANAV
jgi:hypothetical protein